MLIHVIATIESADFS